MTPMERTLKLFKSRGYLCGIVERFIPARKIKIDLFGIIDLVAVAEHEILGVQVCGSDFAPHVAKILGSETALPWLRAGGGLVLVGWTCRKGRKGRFRPKYEARVRRFGPADWEEPRWLA